MASVITTKSDTDQVLITHIFFHLSIKEQFPEVPFSSSIILKTINHPLETQIALSAPRTKAPPIPNTNLDNTEK